VLVHRGWSRGSRPWFATAAAVGTALVYVLMRREVYGAFLSRAGDVRASLPLWTEVARLPMSLFLATPYLPVWAACAQILVVFGLAEIVLGRRLTIFVAITGHFGATLALRAVLYAIHGSAVGLTPALVHVLDTGPSAATTAVGACVLVAARMNRSAALLILALVVADVVAPGVDGAEHLLALACGLASGVAYRLAAARSGQGVAVRARVVGARLFRLARRSPATSGPRGAG
jgi:hypothetical protein